MKKEKKVRAYQRRTKSGKTVTVRAHTASYEAAEKAMEAAKKKGAGDEIAERKKKNWELPMDEFLKKLKEERAQKREDEEPKNVEDEKPKKSEKKTEKKTSSKNRTVGTGTNGPEPKKKTTTKKTSTKADDSEPAFTRDEFKEWYRGTGSAADKKVAKALRKQLGRSGYRKFEDEAIDNYTSRGHLSMFKRVSGGSSTGSTKESNESKVSKVSSKVPKDKPEKKSAKGSLGITKSADVTKKISSDLRARADKMIAEVKEASKKLASDRASKASKSTKVVEIPESTKDKITDYVERATHGKYARVGGKYTWKDTLAALSHPSESALRGRVERLMGLIGLPPKYKTAIMTDIKRVSKPTLSKNMNENP